MRITDKYAGCIEFTIEQANKVLPNVIRVTESAVAEIQEIKHHLTLYGYDESVAEYEHWQKEIFKVLDYWEEEIQSLGLFPEAYFAVDFRSTVPTVVLCWTYGETGIAHVHRMDETFQQRRPIEDRRSPGFENSQN